MARTEVYKKKKNRTTSLIVFSLAFLFILSSIGFWIVYPFPSDEKVPYFTEDYTMIYEEGIFNDQAVLKDQLYIPYTFIKQQIDSSIEFDEDSSSVIITTDQKVYQMPSDSLNYYINNSEQKLSFPALKQENGSLYLASEWLQKVYPIEIRHFKDTKSIQILEHDQILQKATMRATEDEDLRRMRTAPTLTSPYVAEISEGVELFIEEDTKEYFKVRTENGVAGYLKKSVVQLNGTDRIKAEVQANKIPFKPSIEWPVHVTWDGIYQASANPTSQPDLEGVKVLSPTWFELQNGEGDIRNIASKPYVEQAHEKGYRVWALFSNAFEPDWTQKALSTYESRQKMIKQLLQYAEIYNLDGLNLDFENVYEQDGPKLTQFARELTPLAHEAGLVVSMDITFISESAMWSKFYERKELADAVDYLMVMAYDEHWSSSQVAGSVSSLPWVKRNLNQLLQVVPHDRLILGVPLYTRLWKIEQGENGEKVSSESFTMEEAEKWMKERDLEPQYDKSTGQDYVEYQVPDKPITYKMWLENETSLAKRAQLVHQFQLAGIATWSKYFADDEAWKTLDQELSHRKIVQKSE
ncbi:glycosyl hydrolase family 18 protein [Pontibacillus marinus]|uniref:Spore peptidoglycan hydrolase n=1 Tax=Pontibacillus marinus BH030004 = DSM 16465 TaxID=1385511 RepID=A0A0A5GE85_9BACI|nr:glycosyl hydrolase family 18 protein [Pontibacillus marinus]KGX91506.1 spore peptidoglycan hydrolase [Pontibacillus marinus BH030004 = DSM 16465]